MNSSGSRRLPNAGVNVKNQNQLQESLFAALKSCGKSRDLEIGKRLHALVIQHTDDDSSNIYVSNSLLDMYAKCGIMAEARRVFDGMQKHNLASWNALIRGYAQIGEARIALDLFQWMQQDEDFLPDARTYVAALIACSNSELFIRQGIQIHRQLSATDLKNDLVASCLVVMYAKCDRIGDASLVFNAMNHRTLSSWAAIIAAYARSTSPDLALKSLAEMQQEGFAPDAPTFVAALKACTALLADHGKLHSAQDFAARIHFQLVQAGLESNIFVATAILDFYAKCGWMPEAKRVFDAMQQHDIVSWTALLWGYVQAGENRLALDLFVNEMQLKERIVPQGVTFVAAIKACAGLASGNNSSSGWLENGRKIHAQARSCNASVEDLAVATELVKMYSKFGEVADARRVFDESHRRDALLTTAMMLCYADNGKSDLALELFTQKTLSDATESDAQTLVAALNSCATLADKEASARRKSAWLRKGQELHSLAAAQGLDRSETYVGNSLIDMYAKCGCVTAAREVFDKMLGRSLVSWNSMISGYVRNGEAEFALETFARLMSSADRGGFMADARSYVAAFNACAKLGNLALEQGMAIHSHLRKSKLDFNSFLVGSLVDMYAKCGSLASSCQVLDANPQSADKFSWTALLLGFVEAGDAEQALEIFAIILQLNRDTLPDARTFVGAIKACSTAAAAAAAAAADFDREGKFSWLEKAMWIHALARECDHEKDPFVASSIVDMYANCRSVEDGRRVFEQAVISSGSSSNVVLWNAMIMGYVVCEKPELALTLFCCLLDEGGDATTAGSYVAALAACASMAKLEESSQGSAVKKCSLEKGMAVHSEAAKTLGKDVILENSSLANSLLDMYLKCGSIDDACVTFDRMLHRNLQSWNSLITGLAENGQGELALELFVGMDCKRDCRSYIAAFKACVGVGSVEAGKRIHSLACSSGVEERNDAFLSAGLIDMYAKCGSMADAQWVFDSSAATSVDLVAWNSLMAGYSRQGDTKRVLDLFGQVLESEVIRPDGITFVALLTACAHAGLVRQGLFYFQAMRCRYGIEARVEHFTCAVDLLGRAEQIDGAVDVMKRLLATEDVRTDLKAWRALLAACVKCRNQGLAKLVFQTLVTLSTAEEEASAYVLLSSCI